MSDRSLFRVYTLRLANFLQAQGFTALEIVPDQKHKGFLNWLFEDSAELREAVNGYRSAAREKQGGRA